MHRHCPIPEVFDGGHSTFLHTWTVLPSIRNQKVCNKFVARFLNVLPSIRNQKVSNKLMCAKFSCGVAGFRIPGFVVFRITTGDGIAGRDPI